MQPLNPQQGAGSPTAGKLWLSPVKLAPLPLGYCFEVSTRGLTGPLPVGLIFCLGSDTNAIHLGPPSQMFWTQGDSGLNHFCYQILLDSSPSDLAGKTLPCWVVAKRRTPQGEVVVDWSTKSNTQSIAIPVFPSPCWDAFHLHPSVPLGTDWVRPVYLPPGQGRRLFYPAAGGRGYFVDPGGSLETKAAQRGYDIYTFWLAAFRIAIKTSTGVTSGVHLAYQLGAVPPIWNAPPLAGWSTLLNILGTTGMQDHVMWTASRVIVHFDGHVHEWGPGGFTRTAFETWTKPPKNESWDIRYLGPNHGFKFKHGAQSI